MAIQSTTALATVTLTSSSPSVVFSNIPQGYSDLILVSSARSAGAVTEQALLFQVNADNGSNYSGTRLLGFGSSTASSDLYGANGSPYGSFDIGYLPGASSTSGVFGLSRITVFDYNKTNKTKSALCKWDTLGSSNSYTTSVVNLWNSTAAVSSITLYMTSGIAAGSTFALYGRIS
jgi:hypothetical protein